MHKNKAQDFIGTVGRMGIRTAFRDEGEHHFRDEAEQFQADPGKVFGFAGMISTGSGASLDNTMAGSLRIGRLWVAR